jgi:hypothetical protein
MAIESLTPELARREGVRLSLRGSNPRAGVGMSPPKAWRRWPEHNPIARTNAPGHFSILDGSPLAVDALRTEKKREDDMAQAGLYELGTADVTERFRLALSMAPRFSSKVTPQNSPVWRVLAISRWRDRRLRFLAAGHGVSGSAEWGWAERWA